MTDKQRLDWIEKNCRHGFNVKVNKNLGGDWEIFTIQSQHVHAKTLRECIDLAIATNVRSGKEAVKHSFEKLVDYSIRDAIVERREKMILSLLEE